MIRLVFLLLVITALSLGAAWIADEPGRVAIDWGAYHIETSVLVVLAGVCIAALWCMILYYLVYALLRTPRSWLRSRLAKRQTLGLEALTAAFAAIATQDLRTARKQIGRAQQYLPHQPLTLMLASQVARLEGNESQSRLYLEQMLKSEPTEYMALRGLIETSRRGNDHAAAIRHGERALALKGPDGWLVRALAGLYVPEGRAQEALKLIEAARRKRTISRKEAASLSAMVLLAHAGPLAGAQRYDLAVPPLKDALTLMPELTPASALLAEAYAGDTEISKALKVIAASWRILPHPLLTAALLRCFDAAKTRDAVARQARKLVRQQPGHRESRFLLAELALRNGETEIARNELKHLLDDRETQRACALMAEARQAEGASAAASEWLTRARAALPDPSYVCGNCNQPSPGFELTCPHCGSVGAMEWRAA